MAAMKAARLHAIGDFRVEPVEIPSVQGGELLLKVGACGICGSDIPRIYQHGTSNQKYPLTIGHEFSGTVAAVGDKADPSLIGKRGAVFPMIPCGVCDMCRTGNYAMCAHYDYLGSRRDGGFAEYVALPSAWNFVAANNPEVPMEVLCMMEPACVAQHAVRQSGLSAGERVIIFGAGPIGLLTARWARIFGAAGILLVDVDDKKIAFAQAHGFRAMNSRIEDPGESFRKLYGRGADVAIEGTGFSNALEGCIAAVKAMGRIVLLGNPGEASTVIGQKFHSSILRKELQVVGTWNSGFSPFPLNEWDYTMALLDKGILETGDLITHKSTLDTLPALCSQIRNREISACKAVCVVEE